MDRSVRIFLTRYAQNRWFSDTRKMPVQNLESAQFRAPQNIGDPFRTH